MIREFLSNLHWTALPIITMFLFFSVFLGSVVWVFRQGSREKYEAISKSLFSEENT